tara:strand:- start:1319 stop:2314 length:996 start_codon:yes stop_codon:yes gene_type:complete
MGGNSFKVLKYRHIGTATKEIVDYIDSRRKGLEKSLKTRWDKLNKFCMGGIDWNTIVTIGGMSGSGKSSIANELETSLFENNPDQNFAVLSFNFEMIAMKQVGRKISSKLQMTVGDLYSSKESLTDEVFEQVESIAEEISKEYDINYVDSPGTVEQIYKTILDFAQERLHNNPELGIVIMLDHTLLTKGRQRDSEREILAHLYKMFMAVKKEIKCMVIVLSQLNRNLESSDRLSNPLLHYPMKKDIFGSDSVFHGSDYVLITHKPFMLNLQTYGPNNLPIMNPMNGQQAMIYWHLIKNRDGESGLVLSMTDSLKYNRVDEYYEPGKIDLNN